MNASEQSIESELATLSHAQRERLAFIDFSLQYFGSLSRQSLIQRFATGLAASTRDFALYKQLAPGNMQLDQASKRYYRQNSFVPLFKHKPHTILHSLSRGFGDGLAQQVLPSQHCVDVISLIHPDASIVAELMRSIHNQYPIDVEYVSLSAGRSNRQIVAHAMINNGHRWHVRAYDCQSQQFKDFVCTRFTHIRPVQRAITLAQDASQDNAWQTQVTLELIPHPSLKHTQAVELDYAMTDGVKRVTTRAALAAYLLRYWQVDCSVNSRIIGQGCQLALNNTDILAHIENAHLAPGVPAK